MHLYSPERPEASPDRKALLRDGCAVPHLYIMPMANGLTEVSVMLRKGTDSFGWFSVEVPDPEVGDMARHYRDDPEGTLASYFAWQAQDRKQRFKASVAESYSDTGDLL
jgi:hypothetical protein